MPYESTITFTLDTICPWTYLGYLRLRRALTNYRTNNPSSPATFTLTLAPYQLYSEFSQTGEDKHRWYKREKYNDSDAHMEAYSAHMRALGEKEGIAFDFSGGMMANTLHAHRVLGCLQENKGNEVALKALESLYKQYFEEKKHPSEKETLVRACVEAGLQEKEAVDLVDDESEGLVEVKSRVREQTGNGVDNVPYVVFEGRRRDFTLIGAKEVGEYEKVLAQVAKECL